MKCPGQDMKYWKDNAIFDVACPKCGTSVEFYKDDTSRKCGSCGHRFVNPKMDFGCASYCQYAEQCLGALPEDFTGGRDNLLKDKVAPVLGAAEVLGDTKICKVSIVGIGMRSHVGIASKMFRSLSEEGINIQMISTSEIKTSVVIDEKYMELAVRALHKAFDLDQPKA